MILGLRRYLVESESKYKHVIIFIILFFSHSVLMCQGQCLQFSSYDSQWFTRYDFMKHEAFHG